MAVTAEQQKQANAASSTISKATKAIIVIIGGLTALFLLKLIKILTNKKNKKITEQEADAQITSLKTEWYTRVSKSIEDAWTKGVIVGMQASKAQGVKPTGKGSKASENALSDILKDVKRSIDDAERLLSSAISSDNISDVDKISKSITLRQQMSGEASLKYAVAGIMESELASPDTQKMWVSTNPKEPCAHCQRLNGMVRDWGEEFPHSFTGIYKLKVYGGILLGPLRHPHCLCILIRVPKETRNA